MFKKLYSIPVLVLFYLVSNFFMLVNNARYWDDWCFYSLEGMRAISIGVGSPFMVPIHATLMKAGLMTPLLYHLFVGMIEVTGIVLFYKILSLLRVKQTHVFVLTAFFSLVPYNQAKMNICCFVYSLGLMFFLLAVLFFLSAIFWQKLLQRVISLVFFFLGYILLPSTMLLALAFFLFLAVLQEQHDASSLSDFAPKVVRKLLSWLDFLLIPFIYWGFRLAFWQPTGSYSGIGYREVVPNHILLAPVNLFKVFFYNIVGLLGEINKSLSSQTGIFAVLFVVVLVLLFIFLRKFELEELKSPGKMFITGLYFFFAGALAYVLVGQLPQFGSVLCRHQILLKVGTPFMILAFVSLFRSESIQRGAIAVIIALFIIANISWQLQFQKSWIKQMALESVFAKEKLLAENVNFSVVDNTREYNEYGGNLAVYCYAGIFRKIYVTQSRYVVNYKYHPENFATWDADQLSFIT